MCTVALYISLTNIIDFYEPSKKLTFSYLFFLRQGSRSGMAWHEQHASLHAVEEHFLA